MARVLLVLSSHDRLGDTRVHSGVWIDEFATPYFAYRDSGHEVVVASPAGGRPPIDRRSVSASARTAITARFFDDPDAELALSTTVPLAEIDPERVDAVHVPGGYPQLSDLLGDPEMERVLLTADRRGIPLALVCHAPGLLSRIRTPAGEPFVRGRRLTCFSRSEEESVDMTRITPLLVEEELVGQGARYSTATADWQPHVVRDGVLVTGQNTVSTPLVVAEVLDLLD